MKSQYIATLIRYSLSTCTVAIALICSAGAYAEGVSEMSGASINASIAVPVAISEGTGQFFKDAGQLSVTGVKVVGNVSVVTLRSVATGVEMSVKVTGKVIEGSAVATGVVLEKIASATGTVLVASGKALMFVPNEVGTALLHHSRARDV